MYRMFEITKKKTDDPRIVCRDGYYSEINDGFFLSNHPIDVSKYAKIYTDEFHLLQDSTLLSKKFPGVDVGIQHRGANGNWYFYHIDNQSEHLDDLINMG